KKKSTSKYSKQSPSDSRPPTITDLNPASRYSAGSQKARKITCRLALRKIAFRSGNPWFGSDLAAFGFIRCRRGGLPAPRFPILYLAGDSWPACAKKNPQEILFPGQFSVLRPRRGLSPAGIA